MATLKPRLVQLARACGVPVAEAVKMAYALRIASRFGRPSTLLSKYSACLTKTSPSSVPMATDAAGKLQRGEDFFEKNTRLSRPLSPHLTIYDVQLTMVLSISHRMTGAAMAVGLYGLAASSLVLPNNFTYYVEAMQAAHISPVLLVPVKFALATTFFFHFLNGVRHLAWDLGVGYSIKEVYTSGYAVTGAAVLLATLLVIAQ